MHDNEADINDNDTNVYSFILRYIFKITVIMVMRNGVGFGIIYW